MIIPFEFLLKLFLRLYFQYFFARKLNMHYFIFSSNFFIVRLIFIAQMSMSTLDPKLYHYQYRRPRLFNPTYNSSNIFNSLNMFAHVDIPTPLANSYVRYSLPKNQKRYANYSQNIDYQSNQETNNLSTILPSLQRQRKGSISVSRDPRSFQALQDNRYRKQGQSQLQKMKGSQLRKNVENRSHLSYKIGDSLSKGLEEFQSLKR